MNMDHSKYIDQTAEYVLEHYHKRQADNGLRDVETRIRNTKRQIEDCVTAFVEAKSSTLRESIENKIVDYEKLIETLTLQKQQLEQELKSKMTKEEAIGLVKKYIDVNNFDSHHKSRFIDIMVQKIYSYNDGQVIYFNLVN